MAEVYKKYGLEPGTQDFVGHSLALHLDDGYLNQPAKETHERILLYMNSMVLLLFTCIDPVNIRHVMENHPTFIRNILLTLDSNIKFTYSFHDSLMC